MWSTYTTDDYRQWPSSNNLIQGQGHRDLLSYPASGHRPGQWWDGDPAWHNEPGNPSGGNLQHNRMGEDRLPSPHISEISAPMSGRREADKNGADRPRQGPSLPPGLTMDGKGGASMIHNQVLRDPRMERLPPEKMSLQQQKLEQQTLELREARTQQQREQREQQQGKAQQQRQQQAREMRQQQGKGATVGKAQEKRRVQPEPSESREGNFQIVVSKLLGPEQKLGLNLRGVKVENFCQSDAINLGWRKGDIITAVNNTRVTNFEQFSSIFEKAKAQILTKPITFKVYRAPENKDWSDAQTPSPQVESSSSTARFWVKVNVAATNWSISGQEYICNSSAGIAIRADPGSVSNPRIGAKVEGKGIFKVSDALMGSDQRMYVKLADNRGWIFDDSSLVPKNPTVEKVPMASANPPHYDRLDGYDRLNENLERLRAFRDERIRRAEAGKRGVFIDNT